MMKGDVDGRGLVGETEGILVGSDAGLSLGEGVVGVTEGTEEEGDAVGERLHRPHEIGH